MARGQWWEVEGRGVLEAWRAATGRAVREAARDRPAAPSLVETGSPRSAAALTTEQPASRSNPLANAVRVMQGRSVAVEALRGRGVRYDELAQHPNMHHRAEDRRITARSLDDDGDPSGGAPQVERWTEGVRVADGVLGVIADLGETKRHTREEGVSVGADGKGHHDRAKIEGRHGPEEHSDRDAASKPERPEDLAKGRPRGAGEEEGPQQAERQARRRGKYVERREVPARLHAKSVALARDPRASLWAHAEGFTVRAPVTTRVARRKIEARGSLRPFHVSWVALESSMQW